MCVFSVMLPTSEYFKMTLKHKLLYFHLIPAYHIGVPCTWPERSAIPNIQNPNTWTFDIFIDLDLRILRLHHIRPEHRPSKQYCSGSALKYGCNNSKTLQRLKLCSKAVPNSNVEDVGPYGAGYSHVTQPLACHNNTGDEVRDGGSSC